MDIRKGERESCEGGRMSLEERGERHWITVQFGVKCYINVITLEKDRQLDVETKKGRIPVGEEESFTETEIRRIRNNKSLLTISFSKR